MVLEPTGERCPVLINPGVFGIQRPLPPTSLGPLRSKYGQSAIDISTRHGSAQDHLHAAPSMVATPVRSRLVGAAEVGHSERGHLLREVELHSGIVEGTQCRAQLREQALLRCNLVAMSIKSAQSDRRILWRFRLSAERTRKQLRYLFPAGCPDSLREIRLRKRRAGRDQCGFETVLLSARELEVMELADWISETPVSKVSKCCNACKRAVLAAELSKPERPGVVPGNHSVRLGLLAGAKNRGAGHGCDRREQRARIEAAVNVVGKPARPACLVKTIEFERLPLLLLIGMREKICWNGRSRRQVLRPRKRRLRERWPTFARNAR